MHYKVLGKSDLKISEIGLGCMSLGSAASKRGEEIIVKAIDGGINYFDTADLYEDGGNEELLGKVFAGRRNKFIIATKAGNQRRADGTGWDWNPRKSYILECAENSLRRLRTDYIDLYQLHGGTINDDIAETIEAFEILKQQGKIRFYGISSIRPNVIREYAKKSNIVSVMLQYSLADRRPEEEVLDLLKNANIGVLARGALAQGFLSYKQPQQYLNHSAKEMENAFQKIKDISAEVRTPTQTVLRYVMQRNEITAPVVGVSKLQQLEEILNTPSTPELSKEELNLLEESLAANFYADHR